MKRISMWSGPRNVSTAIMYSFAQRPDTKVVDEPLYGYYLQSTGFDHPGSDHLVNELETDSSEIIRNMIESNYEKEIVFFKNMSHHLYGLDLEFVLNFNNIILIRDPREVLISLSKTLDHIEVLDTGFEFQWKLSQYLSGNNKPVIVIDSRDLLSNPKAYLRKLCDALEIDYYESMSSWGKGGIPEDGPWAKYWYQNVHNSQGFIPYKPNKERIPETLLKVYEECNNYYLQLLENRLTI